MLDVLGYIYREIVKARNSLYGRGLFDVHDLGARTISVGNITAGGTGKTPLVAYIAGILADRGEKVCILTRGYGREIARERVLVADGDNVLEHDPRRTGDEPLELADRLQGKVVIIADADRIAAAEWAKRKFGVTVFVLDDGFQHRKAKRDVDIVCIDATDPFGGGKMLPAGRSREPAAGLARADAIVITRSDLVDGSVISDLKCEIAGLSSAPVFEASNRIEAFVDVSTRRSQSLDAVRVLAFCGIGNPEGFFEMLRREPLDLVAFEVFPDHYKYSQKDLDDLMAKASEAGASTLLTTAKDVVKLSKLKFGLPCCVVESEVVLDDAERFLRLI